MTAPALSPLGTTWRQAVETARQVWLTDEGVQPHTAYQTRPEDWIVEKLGIPRETIRWSLNEHYDTHEWDGTEEPLVAILEGLAEWRNVGVEAATTTQKTFTAACIVLWFLACFENSIVVTVAPKEDQLRLHLWKEISKLWPRFQTHFPSATKNFLSIRMRGGLDESWAAVGFVAGVRAEEVEGSATKAQGFHAEHMLIVFEEKPGIHQAVSTAFKNTCRAPHNLRLALGNPDHQLDALHTFCLSARTDHVIISAYDHPNVVCDNPSIVPGAVSRQGIEDALADVEDDGGPDNRLFKSRVRGISPAEAANALIQLKWLERAVEKFRALTTKKLMTGKRALGVDVANSDAGDKAAVAHFSDEALTKLDSFACPDSNALGRVVVDREMRGELKDPRPIEAAHVGVDPVGVGAGTVNELARLGKMVRRLNGAAKPVLHAEKAPDGQSYEWAPDANLFDNLRSQMFWQWREDLRLERLAVAPEIVKRYAQQFLSVRFEKKNGKTVIESTDDIKKRSGGKSPDETMAAIYGNWVRPRKALPAVAVAEKREDRARPWSFEKKKFVRDPVFDDEVRGSSRTHTRSYRTPRARVR